MAAGQLRRSQTVDQDVVVDRDVAGMLVRQSQLGRGGDDRAVGRVNLLWGQLFQPCQLVSDRRVGT